MLVSAAVHFGKGNSMIVDYPDDTTMGYVYDRTLSLLKISAGEIIYMIVNGRLIGNNIEEYDQTFLSLGVFSKCTIYLIERHDCLPKSHTLESLRPRKFFEAWLRRTNLASTTRETMAPNSNDSEADNMLELSVLSLLQSGLQNQLVDEVVLIPQAQYDSYVSVGPSTETDLSCAICQEDIDEILTAKVRRCGHCFHHQCLFSHLCEAGNVRCPTCAQDVRGDD